MQIKKVLIKDAYGISGQKEYDLDDKTVGLFGNNGAGKSSFLKSLNFAISGLKTPEMIHSGSESAAVMFEADNGLRVDRQAVRSASGGISVKSWLNKKKAAAQRIQQEIADDWNTDVSNLKILSSRDLEESLAKDAGQILLSYADDSLEEAEVRDILIRTASENASCGITAETAGNIRIPSPMDWEKAKELSKKAEKARREAKADLKFQETSRQRLAYSLPQVPEGMENMTAEAASEELEKITAYEASVKECAARLEEYRKASEHRNGMLKEIAEKEKELKTCGSVEDPVPLRAGMEDLIAKGNESKQKISAAKAVVSSMTPIYEKMGTGVCPLWDKIRCDTDMSSAKEGIGRDIESAGKTIKDETGLLKEMQEKYTQLKDRIAKAEKAAALASGIDILKKALPPEPQKPDVPEQKDLSRRKAELRTVIDRCGIQEKIKDADAIIKKDRETVNLTDFIAGCFSEKGPVVSRILEIYLGKLTDAASKAEKETMVGVVFTYDEGLKIGYRINGGDIRPYSTLSSGEQAMAFLTVSDLLHRIASVPVLVIDDLDRLDLDNLDRFLSLLDRVKDSYENIILAGVGHGGVDEILEKHGIKNILKEADA